MRTVSHLYSTYAEASRVVEMLERAGVPQDAISLVSGEKGVGASRTGATSGDPGKGGETGAGTGATVGTVLGGGAGLLAGIGSLAIPGVGPLVAAGWLVATLTGAGVGAAAGGLLGSLTGAGLSEADAKRYSEGVSGGGTLVTVRAEDQHADRVQQMLDGQSGTAMGTATTGTATTSAAAMGTTGRVAPGGSDETLQVIREDVAIGKRQVERGDVRITSHVVETPVEERVTLHEETVSVDRHPVDRPIDTLAGDAFKERVIEARATGEEAVVAKEARVVEEIALRKTATDRVETIHETVRETKVDIDGDTTRPTARPVSPPVPKR